MFANIENARFRSQVIVEGRLHLNINLRTETRISWRGGGVIIDGEVWNRGRTLGIDEVVIEYALQ